MIEVSGTSNSEILSPAALKFVEDLQRAFNPRRLELLAARQKRGTDYQFLSETAKVRTSDWKVASTPPDLQKRHVEITGPVERKMMINALNSGADVFMADFEDSLSPVWENVVQGHVNLRDAVRRTITLDTGGKQYRLNEKIATLIIRPRGWHLTEKHLKLDGKPISGSIADFALSFFHNAKEQLARGTGPYFYLPKIESHLEARLWNDVFNAGQDALGVKRGSIRATVLIETLPAAFEMEEILYELRDHSSGLNAGRWDYLFSVIKKLRGQKGLNLPDRSQLTMTVPFMRAYTELLIRTCHKHGAHAMGGMAPFIPSRKDAKINEVAFARTREDKAREAKDGMDGTWVAHPDLVPIAKEVFTQILGEKANQKEKLREEVKVEAKQLVSLDVPGGQVTEAGIRNNISVALQYLSAWLGGNGAVAIFNLMEDAATAEISRAQLWLWLRNGSLTKERYKQIKAEEQAKLSGAHLEDAARILDDLVTQNDFAEFLTLPAYEKLA